MKEFDDKLVNLTINDMGNKWEWLHKIDSLEVSVEDKMHKLIVAIECPHEFIELFDVLIKIMEERLQNRIDKKIKLYGFGSYLTGLALKDSDLDIIIDIDSQMTETQLLARVRKLFYAKQLEDIFNSAILIKAKVPILRFQHIIGFQCDMSAGNKLSYHNSELIKFYLSLNKSYRPFFLIIKFWIKRMGLSESHLMKSYLIVLLIIFYLQDKQLVPSVEFMQNHALSPPPRLIGGWNSNFLEDPNLFPLKKDDKTIASLLNDFFGFYSTFEFGFYIISPFLGKKLLRPFENHKELFPYYTKNNNLLSDESFICVQDVFKHDFNPANSVTKQALIDFQLHCKNAHEICSAGVSNNLSLKSLFTPTKKIENKKKKRKTDALTIIPGKCESRGETEDEVYSHWVAATLSAVESLLTDVALVDEIIRKDNCFYCSTSYCAFNKTLRSEVNKTLPKNLKPLELHTAISARLKELPECKLGHAYHFQIKFEINRQPTQLNMELGYENSNITEMEPLQALNKFLVQWLRLIAF